MAGRKLPQAWQWGKRGGDWYITIQTGTKRRQVCLAPADTPKNEVNKLAAMALAKDGMETGRATEDVLLLPLMERFLSELKTAKEKQYREASCPEDVRKRKAKANRTFKIRKKDLASFAAHLVNRGFRELRVDEIKPFHVSRWLQDHDWKPNTVRSAITSIQKCLNWAVKDGYIDANPIRGKIDRPAAESRGNACRLSGKTVGLLLSACRHDCQRNLLTGLFQSGCRPCEIVGLEARHFEQGRLWRVWGKGTKRTATGERVLGLTPQLITLTQELAARYPTGPLFRNTHGTAWTEDTIRDVFRVLRERLRKQGHDVPDLAIPYSGRHTFATDRIGQWGNVAKVARQLGNTPQTLEAHYNHLDVDDLQDDLARVKPLVTGTADRKEGDAA